LTAELAKVNNTIQKKTDGKIFKSLLKFWTKIKRIIMIIGLHMIKKEIINTKRARNSL